jgi:hypothetical protein
MKIGKTTSSQTFDENRVFSGTDIWAEYLDSSEIRRRISFHFAYATINLEGITRSVVSYLEEGKELPHTITNVKRS